MASGTGRLTNNQFMKLAEAISTHNMETIAQGYMDIDSENIAAIKQDNFYKSVPSNRDMLKRWANQPANSGPNQTKKLARLLYKAASEGGYMNPAKVQDILEFTHDQANTPDVLPTPPAPSGGAAEDQNTARTPRGRELTSDMIFRLGERFSNEAEVRRLGTHGLKVEEHIVDNKIAGELSFQLAAQAILKVWMYKYTDMSTAYTELCAILKRIDMGFFIPEILEKD